MKTEIEFQNAPFICITVKESLAEKSRELITGYGKATIKKEYTAKERGDGNFCFEIENAPYYLLGFFKTHTDDCIVIRYTLSFEDNIRVEFWNDERGRVESIIIKLKGHKKSGEVDWSDFVTVRSRKRLLDKDISYYEISWVSIGSVSIDDADEFSVGLCLAVTLARECTEQFIPSKDNPVVI
jgi:hypothetical protein